MNEQRRKEIARAVDLIEQAKGILETAQSDEQDSRHEGPGVGRRAAGGDDGMRGSARPLRDGGAVMKFRWEAPAFHPQSAMIDGAWGRYYVRRAHKRSRTWELLLNGVFVDKFDSKDKAMGHAEALAIVALNNRARELVCANHDAAERLAEMTESRQREMQGGLYVKIEDRLGNVLQSFRVPVEGDWPLHKVAEEIRSNVENAYRLDPPEVGEEWFKRAKLVQPKEQ